VPSGARCGRGRPLPTPGRDQFLQVARTVGETGRPDKVMTIVYASRRSTRAATAPKPPVGLTHHTTGAQLIRSGALLQLPPARKRRP
jgi:hypothetical protein